MDKKTLKAFALTAMSVLAIACAKEPASEVGGETGVSFSIDVPGVPATKANGDGEIATKLYYQVFDSEGAVIKGLGVQNTTIVDKHAKVNFTLVKGQSYNFVFWAQTEEDGYYTIDTESGLGKITANYAGKKCNDENFDAFYAVEKMEVAGPVSATVTLKRPFAQINFATEGTIKAGSVSREIDFTGAQSTVTVKGIPTVFSPLADEQFSDVATEVTFVKSASPAGTIKVAGKDYNYLAVNYVFAPVEGTVYDLNATLTVEGKDVPMSVPSAPAKQNWRTNIVGNLLTAEAGFDVVTDPDFEGDDTPKTGYKDVNGVAEKLPAKPEITGSVINVTAANAQYTLDGAYGSINGKTINFTESITEMLHIARPTKYSGSNTKYMVGSFDSSAENYKEFASADELVEYKEQDEWTPYCYYSRTVENVKFTADEGVTVAGFDIKAQHNYEVNGVVPHDCVRDGYFAQATNNGFYNAVKLKNISFEGIDFVATVNVVNSMDATDFDGLTFKGCSFTTGITDRSHSPMDEGICLHIGNWVTDQRNNNLKNLVVESCKFTTGLHGVYCNSVYGLKVIDSSFSGLSYPGVSLQNNSEDYIPSYGVTEITGNTFNNIGDRVIRIGKIGSDTELTIKNNVSTGSGKTLSDGSLSVMKAESLADGIVYHISGNNWNGGEGVVETEILKDED